MLILPLERTKQLEIFTYHFIFFDTTFSMSLRINKLLSEAGLGSRREVEKYVIDGDVMLNGERAELSDIVVEGDTVTVHGEELPVDDLIRESIAMQKYLAEAEEDFERKQNRKNPATLESGEWAVNKKSKAFRAGNKVRTMRKNDDWNDDKPDRKASGSGSFAGKKRPSSHPKGDFVAQHSNKPRPSGKPTFRKK